MTIFEYGYELFCYIISSMDLFLLTYSNSLQYYLNNWILSTYCNGSAFQPTIAQKCPWNSIANLIKLLKNNSKHWGKHQTAQE